MAKKTSNFIIGIFVTVGVLIVTGTIVWIGASKYFQKGDTYVTYFDESVQGLQVDSSVKYRGVDVGRVEKIRLAPDNKLIEVVMKISLKGDLGTTTVSQLRTAGITGIVFVELDRRRLSDPDLSPEVDFAAEFPIIPSKPSQLSQIIRGIENVIDTIRQLDLAGISDEIKHAVRSADRFLTNPKIGSIVTNVESFTAHLDNTIARIEKTVVEGTHDKVLSEAKDALIDVRSLIKTIKDEIEAMKLHDSTEKAYQLIDNMDKRSHAISVELRGTAENLRKASETLERLLEHLNTTPSDILFSKPPPANEVR